METGRLLKKARATRGAYRKKHVRPGACIGYRELIQIFTVNKNLELFEKNRKVSLPSTKVTKGTS